MSTPCAHNAHGARRVHYHGLQLGRRRRCRGARSARTSLLAACSEISTKYRMIHTGSASPVRGGAHIIDRPPPARSAPSIERRNVRRGHARVPYVANAARQAQARIKISGFRKARPHARAPLRLGRACRPLPHARDARRDLQPARTRIRLALALRLSSILGLRARPRGTRMQRQNE